MRVCDFNIVCKIGIEHIELSPPLGITSIYWNPLRANGSQALGSHV